MTPSFRLRMALASIAAMWIGNPPADAQTVESHHVEVITAEDIGSFHPTRKADLERTAQLIEKMTNSFRTEHGRDKVESNDKLEQAAADFAQYMAGTGRYGHYASGKSPSERIKEQGYDYCVSAENIAYDFPTSEFSAEKLAETIVTKWKRSPEHRKNMLRPAVTQTGVAVVQSEKTGVYFAVQEFGRPKSAAIEFQIANRAEATVRYKLSDQEYDLLPSFIRVHTICQPDELTLLDGEATVATLSPSDGDRFTITGTSGRLRVERERE